MKQREIRLLPEAKADFQAIELYLLREAGESVAARFAARIFARLGELVAFPKTGRVEKSLRGAPRSAVVRPWLILYEDNEADNVVIVRRILDGRRDVARIVGRRK